MSLGAIGDAFKATIKNADAAADGAQAISSLTTAFKNMPADDLSSIMRNLTKQPAYLNKKFVISGDLKNTDIVMSNTFWVGIHPALGEEELSYTAKMIKESLYSHPF